MNASLVDLDEKWSFNDLWEANEVLDAIEEAEARAIVVAKEQGHG